jgi:hypothetical protein
MRRSPFPKSLAALLAVAAIFLLLPAAGLAKKPGKPMLWGAWIGDQMTGEAPPWDMSPVESLSGQLHKKMSLIEFSSPFAKCDVSGSGCSFYAFPGDAMSTIRGYGAIPILSWASEGSNGTPAEPAFTLNKLNHGIYDNYIRQFATDAKAWGHPFFLRFNWEMNGSWFPWAGGVNHNSAAAYKAAWRHVHDIFASVGATNATWVWCPIADPQGRLSPISSFYPGNKYVDWTCLDGYNWGRNKVNPLPFRSFSQIFESSYDTVAKLAPKKPMLLAETASNGPNGKKAKWIAEMFKALPKRFPLARGLVWFDQVDRGVKWPLEGAPAVLKAFAKGLSRFDYRANEFGELGPGPIKPPR